MNTGSIERKQRTLQTRRTAPLAVETSARDGQSALAGDSATLSGTPGTRPLSEALAEAQSKNPLATFGNGVVNASRSLIEGGYRYPPNLTTRYYHDPMHVGCCADFAVDSYTRAGDAIGKDMSKLGYNPHYCPSMLRYFRAHQQLLSPHSKAHVGDMVFFSWHGGGTADHVAIVTKVDANGVPTQIAESSNFNQPAHLTHVSAYLRSHMLAYGRLKGAGADDGAAAQLEPVSNPDVGTGPSCSESDSLAAAPWGSGYDGAQAIAGVPSAPTAVGDELAQLMLLDTLYDLLGKDLGIPPQGAQALLNAQRTGQDVAAEARKLDIPARKIPQLLKQVAKTADQADAIAGKNDLPLPSANDAWGLDAASGEKALAEYRGEIDQVAKSTGVDPRALAALLWMHDNFKLGPDPSTLIQMAAANLKAHWQPDDLAASVLKTLDPTGKMAPVDREQMLGLFANRYAAVSQIESRMGETSEN